METIVIPAEYRKKQLVPLVPLPEDDDYKAIILLIKLEEHREQGKLLGVKSLCLGREIKSITREEIYEDFR